MENNFKCDWCYTEDLEPAIEHGVIGYHNKDELCEDCLERVSGV